MSGAPDTERRRIHGQTPTAILTAKAVVDRIVIRLEQVLQP
jgi:hypothetical protein